MKLSGSGKGDQSIGLRRRLGRQWVLSTDIPLHRDANQSSAISTFLDWFNRY
jgi:hypothetical protein